MRSRAQIHDDFVRRFAVASTSHPARNRTPTAADIDAIEELLHARFPTSYRDFILRHGCVWTPRLSDHLESSGQPVSRAIEAFTPVESMVAFDRWNASIPQPLLLFAADSLGDMVGFPKERVLADDLPVMVFDHEFNEVFRLADSFDLLLSAYAYGIPAGT